MLCKDLAAPEGRGTALASYGCYMIRSTLELSVVVPLFNEAQSVSPLAEAVTSALEGHGSWELVLVDDGSTDATPEMVGRLAKRDARIRLVRLARNYGQTSAMQAGFDRSRGSIVVSMDGDLQNDPRDIPALVAKLLEGYDLVAGYRVRRQDKISRKIPSWVANRIIRWLTGVAIRDNGCSLKAYRRELLDRMHLYSDLHRFIPAVAASVAGARIAEMPVRHHPRRYGTSKYGFSRIAKVLADLMTIKMIRSFRERPLVMFGIGAVGAFVMFAAFTVASGVALATFASGKAVAMVLPGSALLWMGLTFYLIMLGLISEVALGRVRREQNDLFSMLGREIA